MKNIEEATLADLLEYHNELAAKVGEKQKKGKFKSRHAALKAIEALEARKGQINWPFAGEVKHKVREKGLRGEILKALQKGATMNALTKIMLEHDVVKAGKERDNPEGRVRGTMRTLHRYNGYGIRQEGNKYFLVAK
jgi:hypothetical protein